VQYGRDLLSDVLYYNGVDIAKINNWEICLASFSLENKYNLFIKIALKEILISSVIKILLKDDNIVEVVDSQIENTQNIENTCAKCCYPLPGDGVVGVLGINKGLVIHRENCINVKNNDSVVVDWRPYDFDKFQTKISCDINGGRGELADIVNSVSRLEVEIINIEIKEDFSQSFIEFILSVKSLKQLQLIVKKLTSENFIKKVKRC